MRTWSCPTCNGSVPVVEDVLISEILICPDCQAQWEIINLDPLECALAPEIEEDWGE